VKYLLLHLGFETLPFGTTLLHFLIRTYAFPPFIQRPHIILIANFRTNELLNSRCIRFVSRPASVHASTILDSARYCVYRDNLYERVSSPGFTGYWILQSSLASPRLSVTLDITIFYLHGGGYFSSQPATYLLFLLHLAKCLIA
jgi:hypothetical protein